MAAGIMSEAILILSSVIIAGTLSGLVLSKVGTFESTFTSTTEAEKSRLLTKIKIIYATNSSDTVANIWFKNIGINPLKNLDKVDVYFGNSTAAQFIAYDDASTPKWVYNSVPSNGVLEVKDTVRLDITDGNTLQKNTSYVVKIITDNGVTDEYVFSLP